MAERTVSLQAPPARERVVALGVSPAAQLATDLALQASEERYRQVLNSLPAAVYTCDAGGRVTLYNEAAASLWGRHPEIGVDMWCGSFRITRVDGSPIPLEECPMAIALKEARPVRGQEIVVERPDGTRRIVLPHPEPILDDQNELMGAVNMLVDITDIRKAEAELAATRDDLSIQLKALTRLHQLSMDLTGSLDLGESLQTILDTLVLLHRGDHGLLALMDPVSRVLRTAASAGFPPEAIPAVERLMRHNAPIVDRETGHNPIVVPDIYADDRFAGEASQKSTPRAARFRAFHTTPILTRAGDILGMLTVQFDQPRTPSQSERQFADICARNAASVIEATRHLRELREADRRKDEFLATLAHELRNPLAPVRNALQILRLTPDGPTAARVHTMLDRQIDHMVRLVDDLMEVSRITRGRIELRPKRVDLASIIRDAIDTTQPLFDAAGHRVTVSLPGEPLLLDADAVRLVQVFANLLSNAAKYTDDGGQVWVSALREGSRAVVAVRDTGIGIAAEHLPKVFDLFAQGENGQRSHTGLGIGLTLVRQLVEMHQGIVEARSEGPGQGSEFVVTLPLAPSVAVVNPDARPEDSKSDRLSGWRVLVVDDNRDAADSLGMLVGALGAEARVAYDGPSAFEALNSFYPHAVLLDIGMPGMNGHDVAREIRRRPEFRSVRLIALTGWGQDEDRRRSAAAGFDRHLVKPIKIETLLAALR
jgi:PAS domain S-box-containing protein